MEKILLTDIVMVSDPCYTEPTWCQIKLKDVKPGYYNTYSKSHDCGDWGVRQSMLMVIHQDFTNKKLRWEEHPGEVGVDSGQAGIFNYDSYRDDSIAEEIGLGDGDISFFGVSPWKEMTKSRDMEPGEKWYISMCSRTLGEKGWGTYNRGVVSRSGFGDGGYKLYVAKHYGRVIAMCIDFAVEEEPIVDFNFYKTQTV